ncbi:MAG: hypothetical protein J7601_10905 [Chloroflexi bacterium]|nr:hypothetical protein [Chloroflexota bacterium]
MAYPHIRFSFHHDGRRSFQSLGNSELRDVLVEAYGPDVAAQMVEVNAPAAEEGSIAMFGYAGQPPLDHANRSKITLFVNGQPVHDANLSHAIVRAYHTLMMTGCYPVTVILVRLPTTEVDVNVHPAKAEVRFRNPDAVFSAVQRAVRCALLDNLSSPQPPTVLSRPPEVSAKSQAAQPPIPGSVVWERVGIARQTQAWHVTHAELTEMRTQ